MRASSAVGEAIEEGAAGPLLVAAPLPIGVSSNRDRLAAFLMRLRRMSEEERVRASRFSFTLWELNAWAAHYPDEVPMVNGEFEWIALTLADAE